MSAPSLHREPTDSDDRTLRSSLVPRPKEEGGGKRAWFQLFAHVLIAVEFHRLCILLIYFRTSVTPELILNVTIDSRVTGIGNSINTFFVILLFYIMPVVNHPG